MIKWYVFGWPKTSSSRAAKHVSVIGGPYYSYDDAYDSGRIIREMLDLRETMVYNYKNDEEMMPQDVEMFQRLEVPPPFTDEELDKCKIVRSKISTSAAGASRLASQDTLKTKVLIPASRDPFGKMARFTRIR